MKSEAFTIRGDIKWDTPKAVLFSDGVTECRLPRRHIKIRKLSNGYEFTLPIWLAKQKDLV